MEWTNQYYSGEEEKRQEAELDSSWEPEGTIQSDHGYPPAYATFEHESYKSKINIPWSEIFKDFVEDFWGEELGEIVEELDAIFREESKNLEFVEGSMIIKHIIQSHTDSDLKRLAEASQKELMDKFSEKELEGAFDAGCVLEESEKK